MADTVFSMQSILTADNTPFNNAMDASAQKVQTSFKSMYGAAATFLGGGVIQQFIKATSAANEFGQKLADIASISDFNMQKVRSSILALSNEYGKASKVADTMYEIISSGVRGSIEEIQQFAVTASQASKAIRADLYATASVMTSLANAYDVPARQVNKIADMLFVAVREGKASGQDFSRTLGLVSNTAAEAGVSLAELGAATAVLSRTQSASQSMIGLNQLLNAIIKPTQEAAAEAKYWGIELNATALRTKGLAAVLQELHDKTGGNVRALNAMLGNIRAMRAGVALTGRQYKNFIDVLSKAKAEIGEGATIKAFEIQTKTAQQALRNLEVQADKTRIQIGDDFEGIRKYAYTTAESMLKAFSDKDGGWSHSFMKFVTYLSGASLAFIAFVKGAGFITSLAGSLKNAAAAAGDTASKLKTSDAAAKSLGKGMSGTHSAGNKFNKALDITTKTLGMLNAGVLQLNSGLTTTVALAERLPAAMRGVVVPTAPAPISPSASPTGKLGFGGTGSGGTANRSKNPINLRGLSHVPSLTELQSKQNNSAAQLAQARATLRQQQDDFIAKARSRSEIAIAQNTFRAQSDYDHIRRQVVDRNMRAFLGEAPIPPRNPWYTKDIPAPHSLSRGEAAKLGTRLVNERGMSQFDAIKHVSPFMRDPSGYRFKGGAAALGAGTLPPEFGGTPLRHSDIMRFATPEPSVQKSVTPAVNTVVSAFGKGIEATKLRISAVGASFAAAGNTAAKAMHGISNSAKAMGSAVVGLGAQIKGVNFGSFGGAISKITSGLSSFLGTLGIWGMAASMVYNFAKAKIEEHGKEQAAQIEKEADERNVRGWKNSLRAQLQQTKATINAQVANKSSSEDTAFTEDEYGDFEKRIAEATSQAQLSAIAYELRKRRNGNVKVDSVAEIIAAASGDIASARSDAEHKRGAITSAQAVALDAALTEIQNSKSGATFNSYDLIHKGMGLGALAPSLEGVDLKTARATYSDINLALMGRHARNLRNHRGKIAISAEARTAIRDAFAGADPAAAAASLKSKYRAAYGANSDIYKHMANIVDIAYKARVSGYDTDAVVAKRSSDSMQWRASEIEAAVFKKYNDFHVDPDLDVRRFAGENVTGAQNAPMVRVLAKIGALRDKAKRAPGEYRQEVLSGVSRLPNKLSAKAMTTLEKSIASNSGTILMQGERLGKQYKEYEQKITLDTRERMHALLEGPDGKPRALGNISADMRKELTDRLKAFGDSKDPHIRKALRLQIDEITSQMDKARDRAIEKRRERLGLRRDAGLISDTDILRDDVLRSRSLFDNEYRAYQAMKGKGYSAETRKMQEERLQNAAYKLRASFITLKESVDSAAVATRTKLMSAVSETFTSGRGEDGRVSNDALYHSFNLISRMGGGDMIRPTNGVGMGTSSGGRINFRNAQAAQAATARMIDAYMMSQKYAEANSGRAVVDIYNILKQNVGKGIMVL